MARVSVRRPDPELVTILHLPMEELSVQDHLKKLLYAPAQVRRNVIQT